MKFSGMMAPVFTPFHENEELNVDVIPDYAKYLHDNGVKGVYVAGTSGEGLALTVEERELLLEKWSESCKKYDLKIIVMVGCINLKTVKRLASHAEKLNVDGIAVLPPLFDKPNNINDLIEYCQEVATAAPKTDLFYYHVPFKTSVNLSMEEFSSRAVQVIPTFRGMKYTANDVKREGLACLHVDPNIIVFSGFDNNICEALKLGFSSVIVCSLNFIPDKIKIMFDVAEMRSTNWIDIAEFNQKKINKLLETIFSFSDNAFNVATLKSAMSILSPINVGPPRKPNKTLSEENKKSLELAMRNILN